MRDVPSSENRLRTSETRTTPMSIRVRRSVSATAVAVGVLITSTLSGCAGDDGERSQPVVTVDGKPLVVVTYSILGDVVSQLVGDAATVEVLIPNGQDPHDYAASAHDVETMMGAAIVVVNGLDLEEGLEDAIGQVDADGVPVFHATEHITVRELGAEEAAAQGEGGGEGDDAHGGGDPHLWTDPLSIAALLPDLATELGDALGIPLGIPLDTALDTQLAALQAEMNQLDTDVREVMAVIPAGECRLVTGHESLGYFADRYGCELIGAVIPSLSSSAEASAKDLAELLEVAQAVDVTAIFTEVGTPARVAEQVAAEVGVPLIELPTHTLPDTGGYQAFITGLATEIADGLAT